MTTVIHRLRAPLAEYVELLWLRDNSMPAHNENREAILPDGRAHLVINLSENAVRIFHRVRDASVETLDGSAFCGPQSSPYAILPTASIVMGVHFRAGGAFPFLSVPAEEFHNARVPLDVIYGTAAHELRDRLIAATSPARKFAILEAFLLERMLRPHALHRAVVYGVRSFESRRSPAVSDVLREIGISARRFSRVFSEQVGLTPKLFQRVQRFQRSITALPASPDVDWASAALEAGYYDQAHFIHDFRCFCSVTPSVFVAARIAQPNHLPLSG
jgi:AraC-like DNA-binding protein